MKKFLLVILCVVGLFYVKDYVESRQIEKDSTEFVKEALQGIASSWNEADFAAFADPTLKNAKGLSATLAAYRKIGKLKQVEGCSVKDYSNYKYAGSAANYISANCQCRVQYENGQADVLLTILRYQDNDRWRISYFSLSSPFFTTSR